MCCKEFLKRVAPFFLTFAVGLFIASFFITITAPRFSFKGREHRRNHQQYHQQIESENQRLRNENLRLRKELSDINDVRFVDTELPLKLDQRIVPFRDR